MHHSCWNMQRPVLQRAAIAPYSPVVFDGRLVGIESDLNNDEDFLLSASTFPMSALKCRSFMADIAVLITDISVLDQVNTSGMFSNEVIIFVWMYCTVLCIRDLYYLPEAAVQHLFASYFRLKPQLLVHHYQSAPDLQYAYLPCQIHLRRRHLRSIPSLD